MGFLAFKILVGLLILLIYVKMPIIVGILTFMSRIHLCSFEFSMQKSFIALGPGQNTSTQVEH